MCTLCIKNIHYSITSAQVEETFKNIFNCNVTIEGDNTMFLIIVQPSQNDIQSSRNNIIQRIKKEGHLTIRYQTGKEYDYSNGYAVHFWELIAL
jgi:hypothetical protein